MAEFARLTSTSRVVYLVGNHELYNFTRAELAATLGTAPRGESYYSFRPDPDVGLRVVVLDSYALSCIDNRESAPSHEEAYALLETRNPNDLRNRGGADWTAGCGAPAPGPPRRPRLRSRQGSRGWTDGWCPSTARWASRSAGGCARSSQMRPGRRSASWCWRTAHWPRGPPSPFSRRRRRASPMRRRRSSCSDTCLSWDFSEALDVLDEFPGTVSAVFAGHDHSGGYAVRRGVHHVTLPSALSKDGTHAVVEVHGDRLVVHSDAGGRLAALLGSGRAELHTGVRSMM